MCCQNISITDHVSAVAKPYAEARPTYPAALFDWLAAAAQALHWFDLDAFYTEARRGLKPGGVIAVWSYGLLRADDDALTAAIAHLHNDITGPYWPPERHDVENGYANLAFPFTRIGTPAFIMTAQWDLQRLLGYFRSWSATARMEKATGENPIDGYAPVLQSLWGDPGQRRPSPGH